MAFIDPGTGSPTNIKGVPGGKLGHSSIGRKEFGSLERKPWNVAGTRFSKLGQLVMERQLAKGNSILSPECRAGSIQDFTDSGHDQTGKPRGAGFSGGR